MTGTPDNSATAQIYATRGQNLTEGATGTQVDWERRAKDTLTAAQHNQEQLSGQENVDWEKQYKTAQGLYTQSQQALKASEAANKALIKASKPALNLDDATRERLEDLKLEDPDKWRAEINRLEDEAEKEHEAKLQGIANEAATSAELSRRANVLATFNENREIPITDDVLRLEIPPRITEKLGKGEVTFEAFLEEVATYLDKPKTVGTQQQTMGQPNMDDMGGGATAADYATDADIVESYRTEVY